MESQLMSLALDHSGGPGWIMRTIILVSVVGVVLIAIFALRGYRDDD